MARQLARLIGREPSIAIVAEKYGMQSPEGRGVLAEYITGTVLGAIFIAMLASLATHITTMCCAEPTPLPVPKRMPGCVLASAMSSASVLAPSEGCAASTIGCRESWITGTRSFSAS